MRLSEVKGERTFDVVAQVIPSILSIAGDKRITSILSTGRADGDTRSNEEIAAEKASQVLPLFLNTHRKETISILAAIKGQTPEEFVAEVNLMSLATDVFEMLSDEVVMGFLKSQSKGLGSSEGVSENAQG